MFRWYRGANVCYVYLLDISISDPISLTESVWFTRDWTLQELLAPKNLTFFDKSWNYLGSKDNRLDEISERTGIPRQCLSSFIPGLKNYVQPCVAQVMSWAAHRQTKRIEDRAYSLMGLFDINMPLLYGEGPKAFFRLQDEIMKYSRDMTIFAWQDLPGPSFSMLATSPDSFAGCKDYRDFYAKYSVTKHEMIVDIGLSSLAPETCAMPVAEINRTPSERYLLCVILKKSESWRNQNGQPANRRYERVTRGGLHVVEIRQSDGDDGFASRGTTEIERHRLVHVLEWNKDPVWNEP